MAIADAHGLPISVCTASASPAEVKLVQSVLEPLAQRKLLPLRLIADRAYDSDTLRSELKDQGVELICPHRRGRKRAKTQDGRALRRYKRRWKVERLFAWLGNQRRLVVRWEYKVENYLAFLQLACALLLLRHI